MIFIRFEKLKNSNPISFAMFRIKLKKKLFPARALNFIPLKYNERRKNIFTLPL